MHATKSYLDRLGKDGIELLDSEAAGVLLDLACAFLRRLNHKTTTFQDEFITFLKRHEIDYDERYIWE